MEPIVSGLGFLFMSFLGLILMIGWPVLAVIALLRLRKIDLPETAAPSGPC